MGLQASGLRLAVCLEVYVYTAAVWYVDSCSTGGTTGHHQYSSGVILLHV